MSDYCKTCGAYFMLDGDRKTHRCPPAWRVTIPDVLDEPITVHAYSAQTAAELACNEVDGSGDYPILESGVVQVRVEPVDNGRAHLDDTSAFKVYAETVPEYTAYRVPTQSEEEPDE